MAAQHHLRDFLRDWQASGYPTKPLVMTNLRDRVTLYHDLTKEMNLERTVTERNLRELPSASECGLPNGVVVFKSIEHAHMACQFQHSANPTEWKLTLQDDHNDVLWSSMQHPPSWWRRWASYFVLLASFVGACFLVYGAHVIVCTIFKINYRPDVENDINIIHDTMTRHFQAGDQQKAGHTMHFMKDLYTWLTKSPHDRHAGFVDPRDDYDPDADVHPTTLRQFACKQGDLEQFFRWAQIVAKNKWWDQDSHNFPGLTPEKLEAEWKLEEKTLMNSCVGENLLTNRTTIVHNRTKIVPFVIFKF